MVRVAVFDTKPYDRQFLQAANRGYGHDLVFLEARLQPGTAALALECDAVCAFVNDDLGAVTLARLAAGRPRHVALRCTGFNHVDLQAATRLSMTVTRVTAYSPYSVAEHAVGLILTLNRKFHRAYNRVREGNFSLDGLLGFDLRGCTVGVVGTGKIGQVFGAIMAGFGCRIVGYDPYPNPQFTAVGDYLPLAQVLAQADILSLHCPLTPETYHLIDGRAIAAMRQGAMLINTSRGGLVDTKALIAGLKARKLGAVGLDVYEEEAGLFFEDRSGEIIDDDQLQRLLTFPNVLITAHQAFFTQNALEEIAAVTLENIAEVAAGRPCAHQVCPPPV
ncbi:MAG: 2-hydroxyacid dehydrogenase [Gloeomargaritaceae cyanobacterium C42_A2020_066]|nr:2-hydroxyacid dehydrogenase [Gloeomargaritaceae cyanobacterium C42_A2020_066]